MADMQESLKWGGGTWQEVHSPLPLPILCSAPLLHLSLSLPSLFISHLISFHLFTRCEKKPSDGGWRRDESSFCFSSIFSLCIRASIPTSSRLFSRRTEG